MTKPGPHFLPLGKSFQQEVAIFKFVIVACRTEFWQLSSSKYHVVPMVNLVTGIRIRRKNFSSNWSKHQINVLQ